VEQSIKERAFEPSIDGLRFDGRTVSGEWAVISSLIEEYKPSFECGVFGDQTSAKFDEFQAKLQAAGLAGLTAEFRTQYAAFLKNN
jgi:hypothetical protein